MDPTLLKRPALRGDVRDRVKKLVAEMAAEDGRQAIKVLRHRLCSFSSHQDDGIGVEATELHKKWMDAGKPAELITFESGGLALE